eukprot:7221843-Ditylum_brightwellii.AAC.1
MAKPSSNEATRSPQGTITSPVTYTGPSDAMKKYLSKLGDNEGENEENFVQTNKVMKTAVAPSLQVKRNQLYKMGKLEGKVLCQQGRAALY